MECSCGGCKFKSSKVELVSIYSCSSCGRNYEPYVAPKKKFKLVGLDANGKQIFKLA